MDVILLEKIANLGSLGDKVTVRSGYGRNFLIPQGKAVAATEDKIKEFEQRRAELVRLETEKSTAAQARAQALAQIEVIITHKAGEEGKLFGSVGTANIANAISTAGVEVQKHEVRLPDGVIRNIGEYAIDISLYSDITQTITIKVVAEA